MGTLRTRAIRPGFRGGRGRLARGAPEATEEKKKPGLETDKMGPHVVGRVKRAGENDRMDPRRSVGRENECSTYRV
jgi:hypothetical protein